MVKLDLCQHYCWCKSTLICAGRFGMGRQQDSGPNPHRPNLPPCPITFLCHIPLPHSTPSLLSPTLFFSAPSFPAPLASVILLCMWESSGIPTSAVVLRTHVLLVLCLVRIGTKSYTGLAKADKTPTGMDRSCIPHFVYTWYSTIPLGALQNKWKIIGYFGRWMKETAKWKRGKIINENCSPLPVHSQLSYFINLVIEKKKHCKHIQYKDTKCIFTSEKVYNTTDGLLFWYVIFWGSQFLKDMTMVEIILTINKRMKFHSLYCPMNSDPPTVHKHIYTICHLQQNSLK